MFLEREYNTNWLCEFTSLTTPAKESAALPAARPVAKTRLNVQARVKALMIGCHDEPGSKADSIAVCNLDLVNQVLNFIDKGRIMKVEREIISGTSASLFNIRSGLNNLQSQPEDILLVYICGISGKDYMLQTSDNKVLRQKEVEAVVNNQQARLKILITDVYSHCVEKADIPPLREMRGGKQASYPQVYKKLLNNFSGFMHFSSCREGAEAWASTQVGGLLTHYLLGKGMIENPQDGLPWELMMLKAAHQIEREFGVVQSPHIYARPRRLFPA